MRKRLEKRGALLMSAALSMGCASVHPNTVSSASVGVRAANPAVALQPGATPIHLYPADPAIQLRLAQRFWAGDGLPRDAFRAAAWAEAAARNGNGRAFEWLSAKSNDAFCRAALGRIEANVPEFRAADSGAASTAFAKTALMRLTRANHPAAEHALGVLLEKNEKDATGARQWYQRAAESGYAPAELALALLLEPSNAREALIWLKRAADQHEAPAELELVTLYRSGRGVPKDEQEAARWFAQAAKDGLPEAERVLGLGYRFGVPRALEWLSRANEHGDARATLELSKLYREGARVPRNDALSFSLCETAAKRGLAAAQVELGMHYRDGSGVDRNLSVARSWFEKAAAQADQSGEFYLALSYDGQGPDQDLKRALELYLRAVDHGSIAAETNLGVLYAGELKQDYAEALKWYRRAAEQGDAQAQHNLASMYSMGQGVQKDEAQATAWYLKAAENGRLGSMNIVGYRYESGIGVERNLALARQWYERAANAGDERGQLNLGRIYGDGIGVPADEKRAIEWYQKAAAQGSSEAVTLIGIVLWKHDHGAACRQFATAAKNGFPVAQYVFGWCLESGDGVTKDEAAAASWYGEAAKQNHADAEFNLGMMYFDGRGVAQDYAAAEQWLSRASEHGNKNAARQRANVQERKRCAASAKTELFGLKLLCANRMQFQRAIALSQATVKREDNEQWFDSYDSSGVLDESRELDLWFTRDNAWLARASYEFPSMVDREQVVRVAQMVARKYGPPNTRRGSPALGEMHYEWSLPDGVRLVVWRGWPDTTTYLEYQNARRLPQMNREIAAADRAEKQRQAERQAGAF